MISVIPATPKMLADFGFTMSVTVKAIAVMDDDEPIAVGGRYFSGDAVVIFMKATEKAKMKPKALFKAAKDFVTGTGFKVIYAKCDTSIEGSDRFLRHLGFEHIGGDIWRGLL